MAHHVPGQNPSPQTVHENGAASLLYTGVTRGKRLVVLVAQRKAVGIAVRGGNMKRRWTKMREWLTGPA